MSTLITSIIRLAITLLAGVGVGEIADKVAPDANLNVLKTSTSNETGQLSPGKIAKLLAVIVVSGVVIGFILKKIGLRKYKLL